MLFETNSHARWLTLTLRDGVEDMFSVGYVTYVRLSMFLLKITFNAFNASLLFKMCSLENTFYIMYCHKESQQMIQNHHATTRFVERFDIDNTSWSLGVMTS